jgi:1-deoxy-D-xylulose-5-phosphate reductoisomerase
MKRVKSVAVLGATGSIGVQALEIVRDHPELSACALAAHSNAEALVAAATGHGVDRIALVDPAAAARARSMFGGAVLEGEAGVVQLVREAGADTVLNSIVGAAGLAATLATFDAGADLALANKESLVAGGPLVTAAAERAGRRILPVDSEHSALWQCLGDAGAETVESLVVTASGGPFRGLSAADLVEVTPERALAHPTWSMGAKITIDSATLMNKGLEVIEAHFLFGVPYERIEVVVHPQSIVHAMVRFRDGALLAHLGLPDMRVPISYALIYPERAATPAPRLDLASLTLEFEPPDPGVFRCLALARAAGAAGGTAPCALNAANEVAVAAFLAGDLPFTGLADVVERVLGQTDTAPVESAEQVLEADGLARRLARDAVAVTA